MREWYRDVSEEFQPTVSNYDKLLALHSNWTYYRYAIGLNGGVKAHLGEQGGNAFGCYINSNHAVHFFGIHALDPVLQFRVHVDIARRTFHFALFNSEGFTAVARKHAHQSVQYDACL